MLQVRASRDQVRRLCAFVAESGQAAGLSEKAIYHCEVAVEEVAVNILEHGCADPDIDPAQIFIRLSTEVQAGYFVILISDNSPAFNPLAYSNVDVADEDSKMQPGGLGIHFFRNLMNNVQYAHRDGLNQLSMYKALA